MYATSGYLYTDNGEIHSQTATSYDSQSVWSITPLGKKEIQIIQSAVSWEILSLMHPYE